MTIFNARSGYAPVRDVRDQSALVDLLGTLPQEGVIWPLVGPRRAGKTWTLKALEYRLCQLAPGAARYVDLRKTGSDLTRVSPAPCLLLDEPELTGPADQLRDVRAFLQWCQERHAAGTVVLLAMTPAEWVVLRKAGEKGGLVCSRDLQFITPLADAEAERLGDRAPWGRALVAKLAPGWRRNPFLLELILMLAEAGPVLRDDPWELGRIARDRSEDDEFYYFEAVYRNGLSDEQRAALGSVVCGETEESKELELLRRSGLLEKRGSRYFIADPILSANLSPLRIHHVSDIHFGPKAGVRVDVKEEGTHAEAMAKGLGPPRVCDHYIGHVKALAADGQAPHLLVISGDVAEWAHGLQYEDALAWLAEVREHLADHPRLRPSEPHVLLVGGNHDVDWNDTTGPQGSGGRKRHVPFARAFHDVPRSLRALLDEPPESRTLAVARYPDLGLEVLLLGSSEFGGEPEKDPVREGLLDLIGRLRAGAMAEPDEKKAAALHERVSRIDPGLVHDADLQRVRQTEWQHPIRIAVLHHPVSPLPASEIARFSGLINAGEVKDTLVHKEFCLVLHGHAHTGWFGKEQWPERHENWTIRIAAAPSLGSREIQEQNGFNEIAIDRDWTAPGAPHRILVRRVVREGTTWARRHAMGPFAPGR
jgi:3',5'-cyclic AMP phosphodiesterase CpdA